MLMVIFCLILACIAALWATSSLPLTWPNIAFSVNLLSQFMHAARQPYYDAAIRYLKTSSGQGLFCLTQNTLQVFAHTDSNWANCLTTRRSTINFFYSTWLWFHFLAHYETIQIISFVLKPRNETRANFSLHSISCHGLYHLLTCLASISTLWSSRPSSLAHAPLLWHLSYPSHCQNSYFSRTHKTYRNWLSYCSWKNFALASLL